MKDDTLTHIDAEGRATMVDVSSKDASMRSAKARARVDMAPTTAQAVREATLVKGDVLTIARLAGIMAAKRTDELIPLCHSLPLDHVSVELEVQESSILILTEAKTASRTGVEMEALTAASIAALTIYDMAKAIDRSMHISSIELIEKHGGRSGSWVRSET